MLLKLGKRVRALRLDRGWTQEELARRSGLNRSYMSDVERGRSDVSFCNSERQSPTLQPDTARDKRGGNKCTRRVSRGSGCQFDGLDVASSSQLRNLQKEELPSLLFNGHGSSWVIGGSKRSKAPEEARGMAQLLGWLQVLVP